MTDENVDLRALALCTLLDLQKNNRKLNEAADEALASHPSLSKEKRAFFFRLTEGACERSIYLDYVIGLYSKTPVEKLKPAIKEILRLAAYQILLMDSVPDFAAVNEAVRLTKKWRLGALSGFVNAVLRSIIRNRENIELPDTSDPVRRISVQYSMPEFIVEQWLCAYGEETTRKICAAFLEDKKTPIRIIGERDRIEECLASLKNDGVKVDGSVYLENAYYISGYDTLSKLEAFKKGLFTVQDISSILAVEAAGIREGDKVLDVCAAPGGKSLLAAEKCGKSGRVFSRDISENKIRLIEENAKRSGMKNIEIAVWDALEFDASLEESMDVVLVDAPCSGYGVIGKKPDIKLHASKEKQERLADLQKRILDVAARYVCPGGRLIYSTCTISREENGENADWFLKEHDFKAIDLTERLPEAAVAKNLQAAKGGRIQLLPGLNACDGFFISAFTQSLPQKR